MNISNLLFLGVIADARFMLITGLLWAAIALGVVIWQRDRFLPAPVET